MTPIQWIATYWDGIFWTLLIFGLMILVHEFGHFIIAKKVGARVLDFSLGFGRKLISYRKGETEYCLRLFPLGGFVQILGEGEKGDPDDPGNFQNKTPAQKMAVLAAGPLMNYAAALLLFLFLGFVFGVPRPINTNVIGRIIKDMPAEKSGLRKGDRIVRINEREMTGDEVMETIHASAGKPLTLTIQRGEETFSRSITPVLSPNKKDGMIGFVPRPKILFEKKGAKAAVVSSLQVTWKITTLPFIIVADVLTKKMEARVLVESSAGPIGIAHLIFGASKEGVAFMIYLAGIINVAIGMFNLLPFLALDGGRIAFLGIGTLIGKRLEPEKEEFLHFIGLVLLLVLVALVTFQDILRIVQGKGVLF